MKNSLKKIATIALVSLGLWVIWHYDVRQFLSLEWLQQNSMRLQHIVDRHYVYAVFFYIGFYVLCTAFALPGTFLLTMAGGYFFNLFPGALYAIIAATVGAVLAFLGSRYLIGESIQRRYALQLKRFNHELERQGIYYLFLVRLLLVLPFFIVNTIAGLTKVSLRIFTFTTALGIIPGVLIYTYAGRQLKTITSVRDIFSGPVIVVFILIILLALLPLILKQWKKNKID